MQIEFSVNGERKLKAVKVVGAILLAVQIVSVLAFGLSFHTMTSVLMTTLSGDPLQLELNFDHTGRGEMVIELMPLNQGLLDAEMILKVGALDRNGEYISQNSANVHLGSGSGETVSLTLEFSSEDYDRLAHDSSIEVTVDLKTLNNLVGISNSLRMEVQSQ